MKRTLENDKALAWYIETYGLRLSLSTHPLYYFTDKETGEQKTEMMSTIMSLYRRKQELNDV